MELKSTLAMLTEAITGFNKRRLGGEKIRTLDMEGEVSQLIT